MLARYAILTALFVLTTGAMAADKPSVQARERMEGEARGVTMADTGGNYTGAVAATTVSNPAVAYRLAQEGTATPAYTTERAYIRGGEEHPIANVGYHRGVQQQATTYFAQPASANANDNGVTKPAVQARLAREQQ